MIQARAPTKQALDDKLELAGKDERLAVDCGVHCAGVVCRCSSGLQPSGRVAVTGG